MCSDRAYKLYTSECGTWCPEHYVKDDVNHICSFDMSLLNHPEKPKDLTKGCINGYYWDYSKQNCSKCDANCLTCETKSSYCLSCPNGRHLTVESKCELCSYFGTDAMLVGSSGACLETCGDGKNLGFVQCDDGNLKNGDGCSSQCQVEKGYNCIGGYPNGRDKC